MDAKWTFAFYLAAVVTFFVAAFLQPNVSRNPRMAQVSLLPLGLLFFVFPSMWTAATVAW